MDKSTENRSIAFAVDVVNEIYKQVSARFNDKTPPTEPLFISALNNATRIYCAHVQAKAVYDTGPT